MDFWWQRRKTTQQQKRPRFKEKCNNLLFWGAKSNNYWASFLSINQYLVHIINSHFKAEEAGKVLMELMWTRDWDDQVRTLAYIKETLLSSTMDIQRSGSRNKWLDVFCENENLMPFNKQADKNKIFWIFLKFQALSLRELSKDKVEGGWCSKIRDPWKCPHGVSILRHMLTIHPFAPNACKSIVRYNQEA
jgi:hypothetical protein